MDISGEGEILGRFVTMTYETIEEAFFFVSDVHPFEHSAVVNRITGEVFYASEMAGHNEIPDEAEGNDDYIWIPHKKDLNLGKPLVMDFIRGHCPDLIDRVLDIFRRTGAYARFKDLMEQKGFLDEWYTFEDLKIREALLRWCEKNGVVLE